MVNRWALLCGADFYLEGAGRSKDGITRKIPNLGGCVRDVNNTFDTLLRLGIQPEHIKKLTASVVTGASRPVEPEGQWPTRKNIERELEDIREHAHTGDLVYFHYSGHGVQRSKLELLPDEDDEGSELDGMALVVTDVLRGGPYLTGYYLGELLRRLVREKQLRVTVVLDSCHSGGGYRDDLPEGLVPRTPLEDQLGGTWSEEDDAAEVSPDAAIADGDAGLAPEFRDTGNGYKESWLSHPKNCTVITACGAGQVAGERVFGKGTSREGILTHWVIDILRAFVKQRLPSHSFIVDHVKYRILTMGSKAAQTPILFGQGLCEFFGQYDYFERAACFVTKRQGQTIEIGVGVAQGVAPGALYDLMPNNASFSPGQAGPQARVTKIGEFTSTAELQGDSPDVGPEWLAVLHTWAFDPPKSVWFAPTDQELTRLALESSLQEIPGLVLITGPGTGNCIEIHAGESGNYELLQHGQRLTRIPSISLKDEFAGRKLAYIVSHVHRFQALRDLALRPTSQYLREADFSFTVEPDSVAADDKVYVNVTYTGRSYARVWTSLFCFTASYGVVKLDPEPDKGQIANEARRGIAIEEFWTDMQVPPRARPDDPDEVEDTFALFVSSGDGGPISWGDICLPSLPADDLLLDKLLDIERPDLEEDGEPGGPSRSAGEMERNPGGNQSGKEKSTRPNTRWTVLQKVVRTASN
ncbi:caspase domain-containing protein [Coniochaeta sp. 2T2.1]|nr:caspase domain-containing protein [Coniochaeta sp. 2T2.1]